MQRICRYQCRLYALKWGVSSHSVSHSPIQGEITSHVMGCKICKKADVQEDNSIPLDDIILPLSSTPVVPSSNRARKPRVSPPRGLLPIEVTMRRKGSKKRRRGREAIFKSNLHTIVEECEADVVDFP